MLLSGFWSLISELFDPKSAKASYGKIAAAGTIGGLLGGLSAARAATLSADAALLLLAGLHTLCAVGVLWLGRAAIAPAAVAADRSTRFFDLGVLRAAPHVRMLALIVVVSSAGAAIVDYLLKSNAQLVYRPGELLRFFAVLNTVVQIAAFLAQAGVAYIIRRFGLGRTISSLPAGLGISGVAAFFFPGFPTFVAMRGVESVLRASMFRSGYELLFVPMDPAEKRRTKTFLDVTCDRAGDALGAGVVQVLLLAGTAAIALRELQLLAITIVTGRRRHLAGAPPRRDVPRRDRTPPGHARRARADCRGVGDGVDGPRDGDTGEGPPCRAPRGRGTDCTRASRGPETASPRRFSIWGSPARRRRPRQAREHPTRCSSRRWSSCWRGTTWSHARGRRWNPRRRLMSGCW